jgi:hypothetical protein
VLLFLRYLGLYCQASFLPCKDQHTIAARNYEHSIKRWIWSLLDCCLNAKHHKTCLLMRRYTHQSWMEKPHEIVQTWTDCTDGLRQRHKERQRWSLIAIAQKCICHGCLPPSPWEGCHSVHVKPATQSTGFLPPSPREACHVDHGKVATHSRRSLPPSERSDAGPYMVILRSLLLATSPAVSAWIRPAR